MVKILIYVIVKEKYMTPREAESLQVVFLGNEISH